MNGTHYDERTPTAVRRALEKARTHGLMVRLMLGDPDTGKVWLEEHDVVGFIGRSTGSQKVPLMVEALMSAPGQVVSADGGPQLWDYKVLRVIDCATGHDLYRHPKFQLPQLTLEPYKMPARKMSAEERKRCLQLKWQTDDGGAAFATFEEGLEYIAFMQGIKTHMPLRTVEQAREEEEAQDEAHG